jgi:hypothetical protein
MPPSTEPIAIQLCLAQRPGWPFIPSYAFTAFKDLVAWADCCSLNGREEVATDVKPHLPRFEPFHWLHPEAARFQFIYLSATRAPLSLSSLLLFFLIDLTKFTFDSHCALPTKSLLVFSSPARTHVTTIFCGQPPPTPLFSPIVSSPLLHSTTLPPLPVFLVHISLCFCGFFFPLFLRLVSFCGFLPFLLCFLSGFFLFGFSRLIIKMAIWGSAVRYFGTLGPLWLILYLGFSSFSVFYFYCHLFLLDQPEHAVFDFAPAPVYANPAAGWAITVFLAFLKFYWFGSWVMALTITHFMDRDWLPHTRCKTIMQGGTGKIPFSLSLSNFQECSN